MFGLAFLVFGKEALLGGGGGAVKEHSVYDAYLCVCVYVSKDIYVYSLFISKQKIEDPNLAVFGVEGETSGVGGGY